RTAKITLFNILLAALNITLYRWCRQGEIVVGIVHANRINRVTEALIGCFMDFLPIFTVINGEQRGREALDQIRQNILEAYENQDCPFSKIVEAINPERGLNRSPIYNVAFLFQNFPDLPRFDDSLVVKSLQLAREPKTLLDLRLIATPAPAGIVLLCEYKAD